MANLYRQAWIGLKHQVLVRLVHECQRIVNRYPMPMRPSSLPAEVQQALALPAAQLLPLAEDPALRQRLTRHLASARFQSSRQIFADGEHMLPCWLESDLTLLDDWLTSPRYYPLYFALFQLGAGQIPAPRMLEIGVRTGYMGAVFARAIDGPSFYLGLDPNIYLKHGLDFAHQTYAILREQIHGFEYSLLEGYSWDRATQQSLRYSGPFNWIHIDGDHTLAGKLIDLAFAREILAPDGFVLVDDYDNHPLIVGAIQRAIALGWYRSFAYLPTLRGLAVLQR